MKLKESENMSKLVKNTIGICIALVIMIGVQIGVSALQNTYESTISISTNSTLNGAERNYSYDNLKIAVTPTKLQPNPLSSYPDKVRMLIEVIRPKKILGVQYDIEVKYSGYSFYSELNKAVTTDAENVGSGTRYFYFDTQASGGLDGYGALTGNVLITNYE